MIKLSTFTNVQSCMRTNPSARRFLTIASMVMTGICLMSGPTFGQDNVEANDPADRGGRGNFCSQTANLLFRSCWKEATDDRLQARAICLNVSDTTERSQCLADATTAHNEKRQLCDAQRAGRFDACKLLGENRYDPKFDPALFDTDFTHLTNPNPYFPLTIGNTWEFAGGNETNKIEIVNETKLIEGVTCVVADDQVFKNGILAEATDDWFCQAKDGNVYYFGEEVKDYESFAGDKPRLPELVSRDGSFKHGRDGDKGGLFFLAVPKVGAAYLEEFSLGNAEDVTEILSVTYKFGSNSTLDQFVPQQLSERFWSNSDCVVTKNYSLIEPGIFARKYYARGIGVFLEVKPEAGVGVQLVNCNFDKRCDGLPKP